MGRNRKHDRHLPRRMYLRSGGYYYVAPSGKWEPLGRDYAKALILWAEREGEKPEANRTVEGALAHYLETEKGRLREETVKGYRRSMARLVAVFGKMPLDELKPPHVFEYLKRYGNVQANRDKALLSATYSAARRWGWFGGDDPCKGLNYRNAEPPRKRYVTDEELADLVARLPRKLALIVQWAYLTGMSLGDILALKIKDGGKDGVTHGRHKTNAAPITVAWTDALLAVWNEARGSRIGAQPLFPSRHGHYTLSGFEAIWQRAKRGLGIVDLRFHDLRRKAASDVDEPHAQALLQHADPKTTRRHYRAKPAIVQPVK